MVALPAARIPGAASHQATQGPVPNPVNLEPPAPQTPAPMAVGPNAGAAGAPKQGTGGNFRETLWFKKGDVDQMVADARARVQAGKAPRPATGEQPEVPPLEDGKPLEERYVDDGSVTVEDRKKFSLRSGGTATGLPAVGSIPGERMSDAEIASEIGGGKRITIVVAAVVVVLAIIAVVVVAFRGKSVSKSASALTHENVPAATTPSPAPAPTPPPAAAPPAAAKPESGASASADDGDSPPPAAKPRPPAAHKKTAKKPTKGKKSPHKI
jgi:hypothetical protein